MHNTAPHEACGSARYTPCLPREIPQSATSARHTTTPACSVERGRVALAVTRSEKVGAPGGEGLSQAA